MPIRFRCSSCQRLLLVKDLYAGKTGTCPACNGTFEVPLESTVSQAELMPGNKPVRLSEAPPEVMLQRVMPVPRPGYPAVTGSDENIDLQGMRVLVVDDDAVAQQMIASTLQKHGASVTVAGDADTAVNAAMHNVLDLILLDLGLPGGGGLTVLQRLAASDKLVMAPVIVVSASDPLTHRREAIAAGAQAFLQKPVRRQLLFEAIRQAVFAIEEHP